MSNRIISNSNTVSKAINAEIIDARVKVGYYENAYKPLWGGGGLVVCAPAGAPANNENGAIVYVPTNHAHGLSALIWDIKKIAAEKVDYLSKYDLYEGIGKACNEYLAAKGDDEGVIAVAWAFAKEWLEK